MIRILWPYILGSVALGLDAYVIAGLLPALATDLGSSSGSVGVGVAAFTAAYAISGPILAGIAGRRASRSLVVALGIFVAANIATALAPSVNFFIVSRLIAGIAAGVYSPLSSVVAATSAEDSQKGRALSMVLGGLACGTVFGVPLGLLIADQTSWRLTFAFIAGIGALAVVGVARRGQGHIANIEAPSFAARLNTLSNSANMLTMLVTLLTGIASLGLYTYFLPILDSLGLGSHYTWLIWMWGLGGAVGAFLVGYLVDTVAKPAHVTVIITGLLALMFVLLGWNLSIFISALSIFLWGLLGWSSLAPQQHTLMTSNPQTGATAVAANASANYMGSAIGSATGAILIDHNITGNTLVFGAAGIAIVACIVQMLRMAVSNDGCNS